MPKSKRDKRVSLTKLATKGLSGKQKIVLNLRNCVEQFSSIYLYSVLNMRNDKMKQVREEWKPSRFFFGKNKVMMIALGRNSENEVAKDLHKLGQVLRGQCGLLFTDCTNDEVIDWFQSFGVEEYARSGFTVKKTISLNEGPLKQFPHAMEPYLREKLGLPTKLDKGVVTLVKDFEVCKAGHKLTPEQAKILELFDHKLATFKFILKAKWTKLDGFELLSRQDDNEDEEADDDDIMDADN